MRHQECRLRAALCRKMAAQTVNNESWTAFLMMADTWMALIPQALLREWEENPSPFAFSRRKPRPPRKSPSHRNDGGSSIELPVA